MKAVVYTEFGPPEVLQLKEVPKPVPKDNEVLVKIHATAVAKEDADMRRSPGLNGFKNPRKPILGSYLAGEVEGVGKNVTRFRTGDQVYGFAGMRGSTYAEYNCIPENGALAIKPVKTTWEEAAAIPNGILTALPYLRDKGHIQSGQKVLINGASGAVGTAAVQIAKYYRTEVTGVCSTRNIDMVSSLGANHVIDYTQEDFTKSNQTYDIIFDTVGKSSFSQCKSSLMKSGTFLTTIPNLADMFQMLRTLITYGKKVRFTATAFRSARKKAKDLAFVKELIEVGKIKAVIDRSYPLEHIVEAHKYVEQGHKKGNVVLTVEHNNQT